MSSFKRLPVSRDQLHKLVAITEDIPAVDPVLGPWVAGGAVRDIMMGKSVEEIRDIDIFFADGEQKDQWLKACVGLGLKLAFRDVDIHDKDGGATKTVTICTMQSDYDMELMSHLTYNPVIGMYHCSALQTIGTFNITACQFITDGHAVWAGAKSVEHALNKVFCPVNNQRYSKSFVKKYIQDYGYKHPDGLGIEQILRNADLEWES